jgi:hypothetical protein
MMNLFFHSVFIIPRSEFHFSLQSLLQQVCAHLLPVRHPEVLRFASSDSKRRRPSARRGPHDDLRNPNSRSGRSSRSPVCRQARPILTRNGLGSCGCLVRGRPPARSRSYRQYQTRPSEWLRPFRRRSPQTTSLLLPHGGYLPEC